MVPSENHLSRCLIGKIGSTIALWNLRQPTCCCSDVKPVSCRALAYVCTPPPPLDTCVLVAMGVPHPLATCCACCWNDGHCVCGYVWVWVCVGVEGEGGIWNKSNVLATLMNTVDHMTVTCSMWEVARLSHDHHRSSQ